ncbi:hypothetical protein [Thalassospira tepidiphila]|uniref:Uncharacterized protein n=1 Tax=Thalassospira tepidiphila TaxID=393657 RepID=A0ABX0WZ48_9PROT|nr:hypothetical protein [Thalassospira tepidiphila]NJB74634.1 hypothetical protein [Thalassospira tepidiphila]
MTMSVKKQRRLAYPPNGEQLDAIWKFINQQRLNGVDLPADTDRVLNKVLAVKRDIPKPKKE